MSVGQRPLEPGELSERTVGEQPRLSVRALAKSYGSGQRRKDVIAELSFDVRPRELVCIVGPSGIGKTTLLSALAGLEPPSAGTVLLDGQPISGPPRAMAVVFQQYTRSLMPWLSTERNVTLPLHGRGLSRAEMKTRARRALAQVGLADVARSYPWELSGGMQQRVAIARALAYAPEVMLMDEPFASVDAQTRLELEDLLLEIRDASGITVVLVTHDIDEAVYLGDRIIVLGGQPAHAIATLAVGLPQPRDQIATRELPEFTRMRSRVLQLIRAASRPGPSSDAVAGAGSDGR